MQLFEWIRAQREARDWSQAELARRTGLAQSYISKLENPARRVRPSVEALQTLAAVFGVAFTEVVAVAPSRHVPEPDEISATITALQTLPPSAAQRFVVAQLERHGHQLPQQERGEMLALARELLEEYRREQEAAERGRPAERHGGANQHAQVETHYGRVRSC